MREFLLEEKLKKVLKKLVKRDSIMYSAIIGKMDEILRCEDVGHYKNLRSPLQEFKRVHIRSSFVLIFKYDKQKNKILFYDVDHHDNIYR